MQFKIRTNVILMLLLSCVYFLLFLPPNLTGAKDPNMLSIFKLDEYAQYSVAMRMTSLGGSFLETLRNFVFYDHYY